MHDLKQNILHIRDRLFKVPLSTWRKLLVLFALFALPVILFVQLADEVVERSTLRYDEAVLRAVRQVSQPLLDPLVIGLTNTGGPLGASVITAVVASVFLAYRKWRYFLLLVSSVGGAALLSMVLKILFGRDRPELWERLVTESSYSFPSGHAMASMALALSLIIIAWHTRWRWWMVGAATIYVLGIAFSRLYLGVHYPTDIVAGWLVSVAWVSLVGWYILRLRLRTGRS